MKLAYLVILLAAIRHPADLAGAEINMLADSTRYQSLTLTTMSIYHKRVDNLFFLIDTNQVLTAGNPLFSDSIWDQPTCSCSCLTIDRLINYKLAVSYQFTIIPRPNSKWTLSTPVRQVMVLLSKETIEDPHLVQRSDSIQLIMMLDINNEDYTLIKNTSRMNFVHTLKDSEQYFNLKNLGIVYQQYDPALTSERLTCFDKIFAIREMLLNPYIGFAQYADGLGETRIENTGTMMDSEFSSVAGGFCGHSTNSRGQVQVYLKPTTDVGTVDGSLLVSSIFYQTLETTTPLQFSFDYWFYSNSGWIRKTQINVTTGYNFFYDATTDNTLEQNRNSLQIISYIALAQPPPNSGFVRVCSIQIFGWPYCYANPETPILFTSPTILFNSGEQKMSIQLGYLQTYYDPDLYAQNNPYCHLGFKAGIKLAIESQNLADTTITLDPETMLITISELTGFETYSCLVKNLVISIFDTRNRDLVRQAVYPLQFGCCDERASQLWKIIGIDGSLFSASEINMEVPQNFNGITQFTVVPPDCFGLRVNYEVSVVQIVGGLDQNSVTFEGASTLGKADSRYYDLCKAQAQPFCAYFDSETKVLEIYTDSFDLSQEKQFLIRATISGVDSSQERHFSSVEKKLTLLPSFFDRKIVQVYYIGLSNSPVSLKSRYFVPDGQIITQIIPVQISGNLPEGSFSVESSSLQFIIDLSDKAFGGQSSTFNFQVYISNQQINTYLTLTINFIVATEEQIAASNSPPFFKLEPQIPNPIPCLNQNSALAWTYSTPKSFDEQNDPVSYEFTCDEIEDSFFTRTFEDQTLSLILNVEYSGPYPSSHELTCSLSLKNPRGATKKYKISFSIKCAQYEFAQTERIRDKQNLKPPNPTILSIDQSGKVVVKWDTSLIALHNGTTKESPINDCYKSSPIIVQVLPGSNLQSPDSLNFTFVITELGQTQTTFQLTFSNPALISIYKTQEKLLVEFSHSSCFVNQASALQVEKKTRLIKSIPRQKTGAMADMPASLKSAVKTATRLSLVAVIINLLSQGRQGFLSSLLSIVKSLGIILHMFLIQLNYPVQLMNFFATMFPLITFDAIPVGGLYERWFKFSEIQSDHALTDQFSIVGYSSMFIVQNIGSLFLFINLQLVSLFLLLLLRRYKPFRFIWPLQRALDSFADSFLWSGTIDFFAQNYLVICVVSYIQSKSFGLGYEQNRTEIMCSIFSIIGIIFSVCFPLLIFLLYLYKLKPLFRLFKERSSQKTKLNRHLDQQNAKSSNKDDQGMSNYQDDPFSALQNQEKLRIIKLEILRMDYKVVAQLANDEHNQFMSIYGVLILGIRLKHIGPLLTTLTPIIEMLLKLMIAIGVTWLVNWPTFTIFMFNFGILFQLQFLLYAQPIGDKREAIRQLFNTMCYLVLNYHLFVLTSYADMSVYPLVATSVIYLVWTNLAVNILLILHSYFQPLSRKLKMIWSRRKFRISRKQTALKLMTQQHTRIQRADSFSVQVLEQNQERGESVESSDYEDYEESPSSANDSEPGKLESPSSSNDSAPEKLKQKDLIQAQVNPVQQRNLFTGVQQNATPLIKTKPFEPDAVKVPRNPVQQRNLFPEVQQNATPLIKTKPFESDAVKVPRNPVQQRNLFPGIQQNATPLIKLRPFEPDAVKVPKQTINEELKQIQYVDVKTKHVNSLRRVNQVQNAPGLGRVEIWPRAQIKKPPTAIEQAEEEFDQPANEEERLKRAYQDVIEEQKELNPVLRLDILTDLAMRRYFSNCATWAEFMDFEEKTLRRNERMFIKRHPNKENYLNQVGLERAMFWEEALAQIPQP